MGKDSDAPTDKPQHQRRLSGRGSFAIALLFVAGPVIAFEYLTLGHLTIDVIAPRLSLSGEGAAAILIAATLLTTFLVALVLRAVFGYRGLTTRKTT